MTEERRGCEYCDGMCLSTAYVHVCAAAVKKCALDGRKVAVSKAAHSIALEGQEPGERSARLDDLLSQASAALGDDQHGRVLFITALETSGAPGTGPFELAVDARWPLVTIALPEEDTAQCQFTPELSLLVLYADDLERAKWFYELVGLSFRREQHGRGPAHWSARMGPLVLELRGRGASPATHARLAMRVDDLEAVVERVRAAGFAAVGPWEPARALLFAPDQVLLDLHGR